MPQTADPTQSYTATYDAWNRLVKIADGSDAISEYGCNGAKRQIVLKSYASGALSETRHLYYTEPSKWQVVEERVGTSPDSADAERQFVWGLRYSDDLIIQDRDTYSSNSLDERLHCCQDNNWNVSALAFSGGSVARRYVYSGSGIPTDCDETFDPTTPSHLLDYLYCGYRIDPAVGLFIVRHRWYCPTLGVWIQRDPVGWSAGANVYEYCNGNAISITDATGLLAVADDLIVIVVLGVILILALIGGYWVVVNPPSGPPIQCPDVCAAIAACAASCWLLAGADIDLIDEICRQYNLGREQRRQLHDEMAKGKCKGENLGRDEIIAILCSLFPTKC